MMKNKPMTMTQSIIARAAKMDYVNAGELVICECDIALGNDITAPVAIDVFESLGREVYDASRIVLVMDHFTPCKDIKTATLVKKCRGFAAKHGIRNYFEGGDCGIEHVLLPEKGLVTSGQFIIGADSHTCTYGALNAFSTGVGSTDFACAMATGQIWVRVPEAIRINLTGSLRKGIGGKEAILTLIALLGVDGAAYMSLEVGGEGLSSLSMDDRMCFANMAVEAGAKNCIFEYDEITAEYLEEAGADSSQKAVYKGDACYSRVIELDLGKIDYCVAKPFLPENVCAARELADVKIDQVVIGSCTNGRLSDIAEAAGILKGKKVAEGVRLIVIPATQKIYMQCVEKGYIQTLLECGAVISPPTCGPCLGGHMGVLADGETAVATTNRNFVGRMGHAGSQVFLAGPAVAAASAVKGYISAPEG